nr:DUF4368 domain-containing protein [uncultured Oscillibacter sp.]
MTPELLRLLIQKIVAHENSAKFSKHSEQTVEIHYTGIGCIDGENQQGEESPRQESQRDSRQGAFPNRRCPYQGKPKRFRGMLHVTKVTRG